MKSAKDFAKAWGEDATGAFLKFITGLGSKSAADQLKIFDDLDIKQIILDKLQKNAEKYPVDKAYGSAKKYNEL